MQERVWPDQEPGLLGLLPLVYVAWSDLELDPHEVESIRALAGDGLQHEGVQTALNSWLDPQKPPSAAELARIQRWVKRGGPDPAATPAGALHRLEHAVGVSAEGARAAQLIPAHVHAWPAPELAPARFDVDALADLLDGPYPEARQATRRLLEGDAFVHQHGKPTDEQRAQTLAWLRTLGAVGFANGAYPGVTTEDATVGPFLAAFETLAAFDLSLWVKTGVQFGLFGGSIYYLGTERHHALLERVARGELLGCFAMSETGHGSNVRELGTRATYDPSTQEFVIHTPEEGDRKDYVGNAGADGQLATVFAQLEVDGDEHGVHAFLVPIRDDAGQPMPGVTLLDNGPKMGLNGVDNGRIAFDQVRIPREAMLDRHGSVTPEGTYESPIASPSRRFFTMIGTLVGGRVGVANAALTAGKVALAVAIRYAARRRQFGPPGKPEVTLMSYPSHQRRLMPRLATTLALDFALEDLTRRYEAIALADDDKREVEAMAAGLKAISTWHTTDTIQACREACGGAGYLAVNQFAALKADSDVFTTFEGDNTVLLQLVTKALLTGFRQQFADDRVYGVVRFIADRAESAFHRMNPLETRETRSEKLREADLQQDLLRHRTQDQLVALSNRMRKLLADGTDSFDAFTACQNDALRLARAHLDQVVLDAFVAVEERTEDPALRRVLAVARSLFGLHALESDLGWFLELGYVASPQAAAIRTEVDSLCGELAEDAVTVVDAFRLPANALSAPIAAW